jgi:hypothetical protein
MTANDSSTLPHTSIRYYPVNGTFTVLFSDQVIGSASTQLRGYHLLNEYPYLCINATHFDPANLTQDEADTLLLTQIAAQ